MDGLILRSSGGGTKGSFVSSALAHLCLRGTSRWSAGVVAQNITNKEEE